MPDQLYRSKNTQTHTLETRFRTLKIFLRVGDNVTLCRWSAKQTIPLSVLARNQTKAWARDLNTRGVGQGNSEKAVGEGWREWLVDTGHLRDQSDEIGSRAVREDRSRWVGIPSSFVEISLEIHASISLRMHKGMQGVT